MDRESKLYKLRRKCQQIAYHILPHKTLSKIYGYILIGSKMNIDNPVTFNEKLQWLNHNYNANNPCIVQCADKYQMRSYVEEQGYGHLLTPLIGVWERVEDIDWDKLPQKFVLKCTHGCAYNIICSDKNQFDILDAKRKLSKWLKEDFAEFNVELHYSKIKERRIICEEYLGENISDYKFFCFQGVPRFYYVLQDRNTDKKMGFYDISGEKLDVRRAAYKDTEHLEKEEFVDEMEEIAGKLSKGFPFVRIDFFEINGNYKFAEFTFTPGGGMMKFDPRRYDAEWGKLLELPKSVER